MRAFRSSDISGPLATRHARRAQAATGGGERTNSMGHSSQRRKVMCPEESGARRRLVLALLLLIVHYCCASRNDGVSVRGDTGESAFVRGFRHDCSSARYLPMPCNFQLPLVCVTDGRLGFMPPCARRHEEQTVVSPVHCLSREIRMRCACARSVLRFPPSQCAAVLCFA